MVATATAETQSMKLRIEVVLTKELLQPSKKKTLRTVSRLINDTFSLHGHPNDNGDTKPDALFTRKRLITDEEFADTMGQGALTAICFDEALQDLDTADGQLPTGKYGNIVATGSVMQFKAKTVDIVRTTEEALAAQANTTDTKTPKVDEKELSTASEDLAMNIAGQLSGYWNWEVKMCSSSEEPQYRGRGLMIRCVDALLAQLKSQQDLMRKNGDPMGDLPIKLWITSLDGTGNTEYWLRRGFTMVGEADVVPAGMWTSTREISISTLSKVVE